MDCLQFPSSCFGGRKLLDGKRQTLWLNVAIEVAFVHESINYPPRNTDNGPVQKAFFLAK